MLSALVISGSTGRGQTQGTGVVAPAELARMLEQRSEAPLLLDVRGAQAYRNGTIGGTLYAGTDPAGFLPDGRGGLAVLILPDAFDPTYLRAWTRRLEEAGLSVVRLEDGVPAWRAAGLPVVTPEEIFYKPGTLPFVIPRGLCELNVPAQTFQ